MGYLDGFVVTFKKWAGVHTETGKRITLEYPEQVRPKPERFHGRHVLNRYEDGMEKCIGCELCAGVCPARCIYVRGRDNDPDEPTSPGERYGFIYEINYLRCIHCDLCVEACPTEAITETKLFEFAVTSRADGIYTKDELLVGDDGRPQRLPWENWEGGFDPAADTSGWMRATSPSGDADFEGIVAWSAELGYGVRAPEQGQSSRPEAGAPAAEQPVHHVEPVHAVEEAPPVDEHPVDQDDHAAAEAMTVAQVPAVEPVGPAAEPSSAPDGAEAPGPLDIDVEGAVEFDAGDEPPADAGGPVDLRAAVDADERRPAEFDDVGGAPPAAAAVAPVPSVAPDPSGESEVPAPSSEPEPEPEPVHPSEEHRAGMFDLAPEEAAEEDHAKRRGLRRRRKGNG